MPNVFTWYLHYPQNVKMSVLILHWNSWQGPQFFVKIMIAVVTFEETYRENSIKSNYVINLATVAINVR